MRKELFPGQELSKNALFLYLLALLSFLAVHFPIATRGYDIFDDEDLEKLSKPERRVAEKLLTLGIQPMYETMQISLDKPVIVARYSKSGRQKKKSITTPDFYFKLDGFDWFIEVGSNTAGAHKRDQQKIAENAIQFDNAKKIIYTQLFNGHIDRLVEDVHTQDELMLFLRNLSHTVQSELR